MAKGKFTWLSLLVSLLVVGGLVGGFYLLNPAYFVAGARLTPVLGMGAAAVVLLWGLLQWIAPKSVAAVPQKKEAAPKAPEKAPEPALPPHAAAVQLLSILQREGRLIDFLQEDLRQYEDAQIGAAVRNVHEGCQKALKEYFVIEPVRTEAEGSEITVPPGFDPKEIRLVGNVSGNPPFHGELMHRGWRVKKVNLPKLMQAEEKNMILAAAEVEVK